jgi:hypothetical protein
MAGVLLGCSAGPLPGPDNPVLSGSGGKTDNGAAGSGGLPYTPPEGPRHHAAALHIAPEALAFLDEQAPGLVPARVTLPDFDRDLAGCPLGVGGGRFSVHTQRAWFDPKLDSLSTRFGDGTVDADARLEGSGRAHVTLDACFTRVECDVGLTLNPVEIRGGLAVSSGGDGQVAVSLQQPMVALSPMVLGVDLDACPGVQGLQRLGIDLDQIAAALADHFRPQLESAANDLIAQSVAPQVQAFLQAQIVNAEQGQSGEILGFTYSWDLDQVSVSPQGLDAYVGLGLSYSGPATQCGQGQANLTVPSGDLSLAGLPAAPFDVGVSFAFIQDVLFRGWQAGLLCLDDAKLALLGLDLGSLLGLPAGTQLSYQLGFTQPPQIGAQGDNLSLGIRGLRLSVQLTLDGLLPIVLNADSDVTVAAAITVDGAHGLHLALTELQIDRLDLTGADAMTQLGIGPDQVNQLIHDSVLPMLNQTLGQLPLSLSTVKVAGFVPELDAVSVRSEGVYVGLGLQPDDAGHGH